MTTEIKMHHATRAKYEKLQALLAAEYPALIIEARGDEIGKLDHFRTYWRPTIEASDSETLEVLTTKKVPELADIFAACEDADLDPEAIEVEEPFAGTVVADHYKKEYAARGNAANCGDWMANMLDGRFGDPFDHELFTAFLIKNGVPMTGKWADLPNSGQNGWKGRYRMNGRQKLDIIVATRGTLILEDGKVVKADLKWLEEMLHKHPKIEPEWLDDLD